MKRILARRPSPALVIACIALFVALGGVSYGVATGSIDSREIRNNTIRTQDLRNNDIRGIDIRNSTIRTRDVALNTLTGSDIAESKLGKVPQSAKADAADNASSLGGVAATSYLRANRSAFVPLAPATDWETIPGQTAPGYFVDPLGFVHLHGVLRRTGGASSELALNLPAPARPGAAKRLPVYSETAAEVVQLAGVRIEPGGAVNVKAPVDAAENLVSLEGMTFRAGD